MDVVSVSSLAGLIRDLGVAAVIVVMSVYILARSPFSFKISGTYSFSVGKNGHNEQSTPTSGQTPTS